MKAIVLRQPGDITNLVYTELPVPEIQDGEVLVQVKAISINPVDVKTRAGKGMYGRLKELDPIIIGWDISGVITASKSSKFKTGDEVFGMVNFPGHGKAYAEYLAAPADHLALKPARVSHEEAAAATLAALTAYQGLHSHYSIRAGDRVLIHAAAGGVGHYAVQMAKEQGAYVIGTSSAANAEFVKSIGADEHVDYHTEALDTVRDIDFALDTVGGDNIDRTIPLMRRGGTLISIPSGLNAEVTEKSKAAGVNGFFFLVESSGKDMEQIALLLERGSIHSQVSMRFPFDQMGLAHLQVESGRTVGKTIVTV